MEKIFNVFLYYVDETCIEAGWVSHNFLGNDDDGIRLLQSCISSDIAKVNKITSHKSFTLDQYNAWARLGKAHHLYDQVFEVCDATANPLFICTPVSDGEPQVSFTHSADLPLDMRALSLKTNGGKWMTG